MGILSTVAISKNKTNYAKLALNTQPLTTLDNTKRRGRVVQPRPSLHLLLGVHSSLGIF